MTLVSSAVSVVGFSAASLATGRLDEDEGERLSVESIVSSSGSMRPVRSCIKAVQR